MTDRPPTRRPLPSAREIARACTGVRLRLLSRMASRLYDEALRPFGVRISQLNLLAAVGADPGIRASRLGRILELEKSTLSRNLDRLESRGWILVVSDEDARERTLRLSREGRALVGRILPTWRGAQCRVEGLLGKRATRAIQEAAGRFMESEESSDG